MENLQNEVERILEKCAKYKVGQTVYCIKSDSEDKCSYGTAVVTRRVLDYDNYHKTYSVWYSVKGCDGELRGEPEQYLSASLDELKEAMMEKHLRTAEMWKNPIDISGKEWL